MFRIGFLALLLLVSNLNAQKNYIYSEDGEFVKALNSKTTIYTGTPVEKVANSNKVKVIGFIDKSDKSKLYATKNYKLVLAENIDLKQIKAIKDTVELTIEVPTNNLTKDVELAWEDEADIFYEKCAACHAAPHPDHYEMVVWGGVYNGMKPKALPTPDEENKILRYIRAHAKDGIIKEH